MVHTAVILTLPVLLSLFIIRKYREFQWGHYESKSSLKGKVFLITGCSSGIGKEAAKSLAARNACVIMACRDPNRAQSAINDIRKYTDSGTLVPMNLDLSSVNSVKKFSEEVLRSFPQIHVLINNAGVYYPVTSNEKTLDGNEINFGVNYLGHFLLTNLLINCLKESSPSRIVIVSSGLHERGTIDIDDLNLEKRKKDLHKVNAGYAYCASKLANVYHARELAQRLKGSGVSVFALCPGFTYTNLFRYSKIDWWKYVPLLPIAFFFMRSSWQGAQTLLYCATHEKLEGSSGEFFKNCKLSKSNYKFDPQIQKKLWEKSEELTQTSKND